MGPVLWENDGDWNRWCELAGGAVGGPVAFRFLGDSPAAQLLAEGSHAFAAATPEEILTCGAGLGLVTYATCAATATTTTAASS